MTDTIAVWFSCGAASACAAKLTIEKYGNDYNVRVINTPILEEDRDNVRFLKDVQLWLGQKIETAINPKYPLSSAAEVWKRQKFMSSPYGAPCTVALKKGARQHWEKANHAAYHVLGFTYDKPERARHERFILSERDNLLPVLIDAKMTKALCFDMIRAANIALPAIYSMGFPNANCIGCVRATSPTYWNLVREHFPDVFAERIKQSKSIGARLVRVRDNRIPLGDLKITDKGGKLNRMGFECGLFCEEPLPDMDGM